MRTLLIPLFLFAALTAHAADAGTSDAGSASAGTSDAGSADSGTSDAGSADAGTSDAGSADAGTSDAGSVDAGTSDAGSVDAGTSDAGNTDAGVAPTCIERCEAGDTLVYCDGDAEQRLTCAELNASCGPLNTTWGLDCLLPEGAPCEPGYADGASRCNPAANLFCDVDTCARCEPGQVCETRFPDAPAASATSGGFSEREVDTGTSASCLGCSSSDIPLFGLLFAFGLRDVRKRSRLARQRARRHTA